MYCTVCATHLCAECSQLTHSTRTLAKPPPRAAGRQSLTRRRCARSIRSTPSSSSAWRRLPARATHVLRMQEYGKHQGHKHAVLETEANQIRASILDHGSLHPHLHRRSVRVLEEAGGHRCSRIEGGEQIVEDGVGMAHTEHVPGRRRALAPASELTSRTLHETLCRQEEMADERGGRPTVRERLIWLTAQQQEDMPILLSQDNRVHIGPKMEIRVVTLGLDGAGKTTILFQLKQDEFMQPIPTIAVVFVIDSCHRDRLMEAHSELAKLLTEKRAERRPAAHLCKQTGRSRRRVGGGDDGAAEPAQAVLREELAHPGLRRPQRMGLHEGAGLAVQTAGGCRRPGRGL
ncbi:E3 ubiquitin-protein ligase TRIM23 [Nibea albiflora]|uniref:E3 ubiquitin-protein ligase TRIM23 n=1 Tax=Nibea albiflora TaxID=240163 RepID=A0ACB7F8B3_NIBAL|nr:E3 ubiquitin-protein ligase TRIM23 [Nibea albiflora]